MNVPVMSLAISFNASCQNETEKWDICLRIMYSGDLMLFFHSLYYSNQSGQNKHTCVNILSGEHQQLFSIHLEDCKNAKFRNNIWIGCIGEELWCSLCKFFDIVCVYLCFYALLMMEPWHLYTSINSSCKDEHQMVWMVPVGCMVQELFLFFILFCICGNSL